MIILLIGPKGSGKTTIGQLFEARFGCKFLRVEDIAKAVKKDKGIYDADYLREVFAQVESKVRELMDIHNTVVFESTGLTPFFDAMLEELQADHKVVLVGVMANPELCLERIKSRDQSLHIEIPEHQIKEINSLVLQKNIPKDFTINNNSSSLTELERQIDGIARKIGLLE